MQTLFRHSARTLGRDLTHPLEGLACIHEGDRFVTVGESRLACGGVSREDGVRAERLRTLFITCSHKPAKQSSSTAHPAPSALQDLRVRKSLYYLRSSELGFLFLDPEQRLNRQSPFPGKGKEAPVALWATTHLQTTPSLFCKMNTMDKDDY